MSTWYLFRDRQGAERLLAVPGISESWKAWAKALLRRGGSGATHTPRSRMLLANAPGRCAALLRRGRRCVSERAGHLWHRSGGTLLGSRESLGDRFRESPVLTSYPPVRVAGDSDANLKTGVPPCSRGGLAAGSSSLPPPTGSMPARMQTLSDGSPRIRSALPRSLSSDGIPTGDSAGGPCCQRRGSPNGHGDAPQVRAAGVARRG